METLKRCWRHWWVKLLVLGAAVFLLVVVGNWISSLWAFWDDDPARGAVVVGEGGFGPDINKVIYLAGTGPKDPAGQGWSASDSLWYGNTTQGSDLIPYDFFLVLRLKGSQELIRSDRLMNVRYRYLPRKATYNNPDALPIGMVKDTFRGTAFMGFTCSACHTGQVNYKGTGIRIDGAPAMSDMDTLLADMAAALREANSNPAVHAQFVKDVLALGNYRNEDQIKADLRKYAIRLTVYRTINHSSTRYGFARLDAFGRIYNQVLEYVLTVPDVQEVLDEMKAEGKVTQAQLDAAGVTRIMNELGDRKTELNGADRDRLFAALQSSSELGIAAQSTLSLKQILQFRDHIFNSPDAPVSYPFLWDIPQHDYVQWNGIAANAGLGPIGRNAGEVVGVFGTMDWSRGDHWTLAALFSGQGFSGHPIDYTSSVNVHNLALIEDKLKSLRAPVWPENVLGKIDRAAAGRGEVVFDQYCQACHAEIDRTSATRRIVAHFSAVDRIHTDPVMAVNSVGYQGYSGILRNQYVTLGQSGGQVLLNKKSPVAALLTKSVTGVVATPDADKWFGQRFVEWLYDLIFALRKNNIQSSMKSGDYHPDTMAEPVASIVSYKGRALDGIWATAPYLHNGSVPTLYDLLLPASALPGDPAGMQYRPSSFLTGSRELDTRKVGFATRGYDGFKFIAYTVDSKTGQRFDIAGNSNGGHEYGTRDTIITNPDGTAAKNTDGSDKVLPALTEKQRWDLVEYLKTL
jgi:cytochrome c5